MGGRAAEAVSGHIKLALVVCRTFQLATSLKNIPFQNLDFLFFFH